MPGKRRRARDLAAADRKSSASSRSAIVRRTPLSPARKDAPSRRLFEELADDDIVNALMFAIGGGGDAGERARTLLCAIADPAMKGKSPMAAMRDSGVILPEMIDWYNQYMVTVGVTLTARKMVQAIEDIADDALTTIVPCRQCEERGYLLPPPTLAGAPPANSDAMDEFLRNLAKAESTPATDPPPPTIGSDDEDDGASDSDWPDGAILCTDCNGAGSLRRPGNEVARKMLLKLHGLDGKAQGPLVAIQNNYGGKGGSTTPEADRPETVSDRIAQAFAKDKK